MFGESRPPWVPEADWRVLSDLANLLPRPIETTAKPSRSRQGGSADRNGSTTPVAKIDPAAYRGPFPPFDNSKIDA